MSGIIASAVRFTCATHSPGDQLSGAGLRFHRPGASVRCRLRTRAEAESNSLTISSSCGCTRLPEHEIHSAAQTQTGPEEIPVQTLTHVEDRKRDEDAQGD